MIDNNEIVGGVIVSIDEKTNKKYIDGGKFMSDLVFFNKDAKKAMLESYPSLQGMYSAEDDNTEVLYIDNIKATVYSFTEAPKEINV